MLRRLGIAQLGIVLALVLVLASLLPRSVVACNGEPLSANDIANSVRSIVQVTVIAVGPNHAEDVPGSFTMRVDRVLYGTAPREIRMSWPTPISPCDGYVATLGDNFVMALGVGGLSPIWPIEVAHRTGAERSDLAQVLALLPRTPDQATSDPIPAGLVVLVLGSLAGAAALVARRRLHGLSHRNRGGGADRSMASCHP